MNQDDTYRMDDLPHDAAMTPATEEIQEAPPPAAARVPAAEALEDTPPAAMTPARTVASSQRFEMMRSRMRGINVEGANWIDATQLPLDCQSAAQPNQSTQPYTPVMADVPQSRLLTGGAALSTLMRSAVRQHAPAPALTGQHTSVQRASPEQMRGALQQVVRNTINP